MTTTGPKQKARRSAPFRLADAERQLLTAWVNAGTTPQRVLRRAGIVLLAGEALSAREIAARLHVSTRAVLLWRRRFEQEGADTLWRDAPGRRRRPTALADGASRVHALLENAPPVGTRWTIRRLSLAAGLSRATVHRILRAADLSTSNDPKSRGRRHHELPPTTAGSLPV